MAAPRLAGHIGAWTDADFRAVGGTDHLLMERRATGTPAPRPGRLTDAHHAERAIAGPTERWLLTAPGKVDPIPELPAGKP